MLILTTARTFKWRSAIFCLVLIAALFHRQALASPASPDLRIVRQPDDAAIEIVMRGDESRSWVETSDGYSVVRNPADRVWHYAEVDSQGELIASGNVVDPSAVVRPAIEKHLSPAWKPVPKGEQSPRSAIGFAPAVEPFSAIWDTAPVLGNRKLLILMVEFADSSFTTSLSAWDNQLFGAAASDKSVLNYFADNSEGNLALTPVPHTQPGSPPGIVKVSLGVDHPNTGNDHDFYAEALWVESALALADAYVNFASYDTYNNGLLETDEIVVYVIAAGYEAANSSPEQSPAVWGHAWRRLDQYDVVVGGKSLMRFAVSGELNGSDMIEPMGIVAHELGHLMLNLPDLYDTSGLTEGIGYFSLMSSGGWGAMSGEFSGTTPVNMDAWSRLHLGWATPTNLPAAGQVHTFGPALGADSVVKLWDSFISDTDYFLVENRTYDGWDRGFARFSRFWEGGLLVLHVDTTIESNRYDPDGPLSQHPLVALVEADSSLCSPSDPDPNTTCRGDPTNLFYAGNNADFTATTDPAALLYTGESAYQMLTNISAPGLLMTAGVKTGNQAPALNVAQRWTVKAGQLLTVAISASDSDGDALVLEAIRLPPGSSFDSVSETFYWATTLTSAGEYSATFKVSDDGEPPKEREETVAIDIEKPTMLVDGGGCFLERLLR